MFEWIKALWPFRKKEDFTAERWEEYQETKQKALEKILGPMDDTVWHAIIPFQVGGAVDMYCFSSHMTRTVFATMELIDPNGNGPKPNRMGTYELISCTRLESPPVDFSKPIDLRYKRTESGPFEKQQQRLCKILTAIGHYSFDAVLQPGETSEFPGDKEDDTKYIVFDEFDTKGIPFEIEGKRYGLLLCIEIHPSELKYAREQGSKALIEKLKEADVYPYSDLNRESVV